MGEGVTEMLMHEEWGPPEYVRGPRPGDVYVRRHRRPPEVLHATRIWPWNLWPRLKLWRRVLQ
jgi:hypothetical protein